MNKLLPSFIFLILLCLGAIASPQININLPGIELDSGENVVLDVTSNESIWLNYSLDETQNISAGLGTSFIKLLNGSLSHGILENGNHQITLLVTDMLGNVQEYYHDFSVNDSTPPNISLNITNNTKYNGSTYIFWTAASSNEFAYASYNLNSNPSSNATGYGNTKSKVYNLSLLEGQNTLVFNVSDYHNNFAIYSYSINYSQAAAPTCSDALQNGDETGVDCGGACSSCIAFTIATNKQGYNLTDNVQLSVLARANSTVNVTIRLNNEVSYRHLFVPAFLGFPISETRIISNTTNSGNYTVYAKLNYLNITESQNTTFEVIAPAQNPLSVTINANTTTINEGSAVYFSAAVANNISPVSYKWDFQNDGIIDSTSSNASFTFPSNGTFFVNLSVFDSKWSQTDIEIITSRKTYNVTVLVRDNATQAVIQNAIVEIDDIRINTTSDGRADFIVHENNHEIEAKKQGYITFSNRTSIKGYSLIEVYLSEQDIYDPIITLLSPESGKAISNDSVKLLYKASDKGAMTCSLFTNKNSQGWIRRATETLVLPDVESNFTISLENASYEWQVECFDRMGNVNSSGIFTFTSDQSVAENMLSVDLDEQDRISGELTLEIDQVLSEIDLYDSEEKDAALAMQLAKQLERAKIEIQRANRDLHSLKWRRLNESELEKETLAILEKVENLRYTTPRKIEILEKNEFVKYPSKEDVQLALESLIKKTNLKFTRKDLRALVDENFRHQSLITVTTKARIVEIQYISGESSKITLIEKSVSGNDDIGELSFLEVIPKEIAGNISDIKALFDFDVIEEDPIIKIDVQKFVDFAYYIEKDTGLEEIENIKSILVNEKIRKKESGFLSGLVTGFLPTEGFAGGFIQTLNLRLIIELAVIVVLGLVFLYYQFGGYEKLELIFNRKLSHQMNEFDYLMVRINHYLDQHKYDESKILYNELSELFRQLPKEMRTKLYPSIIDVHAKMDYTFMDNSLNEAFASLSGQDARVALRLYGKISGLYKSLPKDYKSKIHARCIELYKKLNS